MCRHNTKLLSFTAFAAICFSPFAIAQDGVGTSSSTTISVDAQPLADALRDFSDQTGLQLAYVATLAENKSSNGVESAATPNDALNAILDNTGLAYQFVNDETIAIGVADQSEVNSDSGNLRPTPVLMAQNRMSQAPSSNDAAQSTTAERRQVDGMETPLEEVVVVGTRIKGARATSPVVTISQDEMRLAGHNNLGEVVRALPQNFAGGQNPGLGFGAQGGSPKNFNHSNGSALNLRGLGADATLTLLNGKRISYDGRNQAVDVSVIPVAAIDRMEFLLDGASAIYGSDAVGGVANIVLKKDYQGAELSARFGGATDGGYDQRQYTGIAGNAWHSGGFLITADFTSNTPVEVRQRDYLSELPLPGDHFVYPDSEQVSALFTGHQDLGKTASLALDVFYTERDTFQRFNFVPLFGFLQHYDRDSLIWGVSPTLTVEMPNEWAVQIHGSLARNELDFNTPRFLPGGELQLNSATAFNNEAETVGIESEGPLLALPAGDVRLSVGGGWRRNKFEMVNVLTGTDTTKGDDDSIYVYGEVNLPLISEDQNIALAHSLMVNGAVRYEDYKSFGDSTTPKFGVSWVIVPEFEIKASVGRSFKVPTLDEQHSDTRLQLLSPTTFGGTDFPDGSGVLYVTGGNPALEPERADTLAVGFVSQPEFLPGLTVELNWFDIDYEDRIVTAVNPLNQGLTNPALAEFVTSFPSAMQQEAAFELAGLPVGSFTAAIPALLPYDPSNIIAVIDNRTVNTVVEQVRGIDLSIRYSVDLFEGSLNIVGNGNWITDSTRKTTIASPEQETVGLIFFPPDFKGRLGASWSRGNITLSTNLNHIGGVADTNATPSVERDGMTTLDVIFDYEGNSDAIGDFGVNVAVINVLDEHPPLIQPDRAFHLNYDSTNYSPLGRIVSLTLSKDFF